MPKLSIDQQRALIRTISPDKKAHVRKMYMSSRMQGSGIKDIFKKIKNFLGPVFKAIGPTVLKELAVPYAKKQLGLGLKLAGQGKMKKRRVTSKR